MKKIVIYSLIIILIFLISALVFFDFNKDENTELEKITVAEVARTIFYAPQYVALERGYFEEFGLDVSIILTPGADRVAAAVLSGDADIGFSGSETTIYIFNAQEEDYLKTFAQLTQRDGSFIVSREKISNFTLADLIGKDIIGGRKGGMPVMTLEWALREYGIDPDRDVNIDTSIDFAAMSGAFIGGTGDFVTLFEPTALELEREGFGFVVASVGELGGIVPYTAYHTRISFIEENLEIIESFIKAIEKGLDFVHNNTDEEVARTIQNQFPDTSLNDLTAVVGRYREIDAWPSSTTFTEESFNHLQSIMKASGVLSERIPFNKLVHER